MGDYPGPRRTPQSSMGALEAFYGAQPKSGDESKADRTSDPEPDEKPYGSVPDSLTYNGG